MNVEINLRSSLSNFPIIYLKPSQLLGDEGYRWVAPFCDAVVEGYKTRASMGIVRLPDFPRKTSHTSAEMEEGTACPTLSTSPTLYSPTRQSEAQIPPARW